MSQDASENSAGRSVGDGPLALAVGLLFALSPLTPSVWGPHWASTLAIGMLTALGFFGLRAAGWVPAPDLRFVRGLFKDCATWALGVSAIAVVVLAPSLLYMGARFTASIWQNGHGLLVPFAMVWAARRSLETGPVPAIASSLGGLPLLGLAFGLQVLSLRSDESLLGAIAVVITVPALCWVLMGAAMTRRLAGPLALGCFLIPIGYESAVHPYLQEWTATASTVVLQSFGTTVLQTGNELTLRHGVFVVNQACSGFSTLYASAALAAFLALVAPKGRRLWVLLAAVPLALTTNVVRVISLIGLAKIDPQILETWAHKGTGVAAFLVSLLGLSWLAGSFRRPASEVEAKAA